VLWPGYSNYPRPAYYKDSFRPMLITSCLPVKNPDKQDEERPIESREKRRRFTGQESVSWIAQRPHRSVEEDYQTSPEWIEPRVALSPAG
jgi:hypothetical protein